MLSDFADLWICVAKNEELLNISGQNEHDPQIGGPQRTQSRQIAFDWIIFILYSPNTTTSGSSHVESFATQGPYTQMLEVCLASTVTWMHTL